MFIYMRRRTMQDHDQIHESVRSHYAAIAEIAAESSAAACCGPAEPKTGHAVNLYGEGALITLPQSVTELALGCGDPVTLAGLRTGEVVLDLGSGGGIDCFLAAERVGAEGQVIGVDMTPVMIEKANANKARLGFANVEFRLGQIEALPVADGSVDVIMSNCVINLSPDKGQVFREAFRVLAPGGRISVSDIVTEGTFSDAARADATQWSACVSGAIDLNDYLNHMREAGFVDIETKEQVPAEERGVYAGDDSVSVFSARITARKPEQG
jgi:arsenite methyltransferase